MGNLLALDNPHISIFGFDIYYYALCIVTGIIVATLLSTLLFKRRNISPDLIYILFICCIPTALICARIFYCITDGMAFKYWLMWDDGMGHGIRNGGLSIIGGVIGGVGMGVLVCKLKKVSFLRVADCVVPTILIAQAIGRWGNYFNQEVYGQVVTNPAMQWFPFAVNISGTWHYAFFFYESVINLIGFGLLFSALWFWRKKPNGVFTFAYFVWYGTVRAIMEPLRDQSYILNGGGVPWSLVFSVLMIVMGVFGIAILLILNYKKEGIVFGSKKGDPCAFTSYISSFKDEVPYFSKINMMGANYPEKPEELTFAYKWAKFKQKFKKKTSEGEPPKEGEPSEQGGEKPQEEIEDKDKKDQ